MRDAKRHWVAFGVGAVVAFTPLLAPIHEFGHVLAGGGEIITWTSATPDIVNVDVVIGGYRMEIWFGLVLGAVGACTPVGWWGWGYANASWLNSLWSTDVWNWGPSHGISPEHAISALIPSLIALLTGWGAFWWIYKRP